MKILRIDGIEYKMENKIYERVVEKRRIELCELQNKYKLIERENSKLKSKNFTKEMELNHLKEKIKDIIFQLEHNPRPSAENRDKYIIKQLNYLLNGGKNE